MNYRNYRAAHNAISVLFLAGGAIILVRPLVGLPWQIGGMLVAVGLFDILWGFRHPAPISREMETALTEASRVRKNDPAAADQLLERYFAEAASPREKERATLRQRAHQDISAAKQLELILCQDLDGHRSMRRRVIPTLPEGKRFAAIARVDEMERQTHSELEKVRDSMRLMKG